MNFSTFTLLAIIISVVEASPVPAIEWVTITAYTTLIFGDSEYTTSAVGNQAATTSITDVSFATVLASVGGLAQSEQSDVISASVNAASSNPSASALIEIPTTSTPSSTSIITSSVAVDTTGSTSSATTSASVFSGEGTYYSTGLGACGQTNSDTDYIVAISHELYDKYTPNGNPNKNTLCGKKIQASYQGKSVEVTVVDRCEGCSYYDLDFSPSAFSQIADQSLGRIDITWKWA